MYETGKELPEIKGGGGRAEQYYEWIDSLTLNTLNSLSQAAAAVCGMRGAGWELLDSWILEACGLISRTKPTRWGGADVAFPPQLEISTSKESGCSKFALSVQSTSHNTEDIYEHIFCYSTPLKLK